MNSIFQSPLVLIWVAVGLWMVASIVRITIPEKKRLWHMIVPLVVFAAAFGADYFVKTDREKIDILIDRGIEATVAADVEAIETMIGDDYADRIHRSKADFMGKCRRTFRRALAESIRPTYCNISVDGTSAVVNMGAVVHLIPQNTEMPGVQIVPVKLRIECKIYGERDWKFSSVELVEVNNNPVNWNGI